jgi:hypothetical protein
MYAMPWMQRPRRRSPVARLRRWGRRWRYDHSEDLRAFWIGAAVVAATVLALAAMMMH